MKRLVLLGVLGAVLFAGSADAKARYITPLCSVEFKDCITTPQIKPRERVVVTFPFRYDAGELSIGSQHFDIAYRYRQSDPCARGLELRGGALKARVWTCGVQWRVSVRNRGTHRDMTGIGAREV